MSKKSQVAQNREQEASKRTPTLLLELPLVVNAGQATHVRAHLEAGRQFYNAVLSLGLKRLRAMRADPAQAGPPVPSHARRNRNGRRLLLTCGNGTCVFV